MNKLFFLFFIILAVGCANEQENQNEAIENQQDLNQPLNIKSEVVVSLLPQAEKEVTQWPAYINARTAVEALKNYNLKQLQNNTEPLIAAISELQTTLPPNYRKPSIVARVNVLLTKSYVLEQQAKQLQKDLETISETGTEIVSEFEYLKIQLNELFLQSPSDFEIDLDAMEDRQQQILTEEEEEEETDLPELDLLEISE